MKDASPEMMSIFHGALERLSPEERAAFLDAACGEDAELRERIGALLQAHDQAGGFLPERAETPDPRATTDERSATEQPGVVLAGRYKLLEEIGEGGMGTVWMAQQTEPVKRLVAVKLIKAGMDSKQVLARFEAERQALALMDHPNIAKVHDAGMIANGRPYFVMELVKGVPLARYCDEHRLTPRERLELFGPVCQAVQHAHQKGIIHRDLKPSNVLIAVYDGKPVPKVIDFGIAKAAGQPLTDRTLVTGFGTIVGTLEYMSPEQAEFNALDIDTRSDIYSLGVMLYELLTGSTPLTRQRLQQAAMAEMLRLIREEEPPRPSTRLSESKESLASISAQRQMEPSRLTKLVRGELDWIVMKALEKDRNRRYETAKDFAADVQRYLADEAVLACPPSVGYRFKKFMRRNKGALVLAGLILFFVLILGGGTGWVMRDRAVRQANLEQEVVRALADVENASKREKLPEALAAVNRAEGLLAGGGGNEEFDERVRQWGADLELVARLQEATVLAMQVNVAESRFSQDLAIPEYEAAFAAYGIDYKSMPAEQAAQSIRSRPPQIRLVLIAVLDRWIALEAWLGKNAGADLQKQAWLKAVVRAADTDSWRAGMRATAERKDYQELAKLAGSAELSQQAPYTRRKLGILLCEQAGTSNLGIAVLRQAQQRYPGDFIMNLVLAQELGRARPPQRAEAVRFHSIAVALQPDNAGAHVMLGGALRGEGKLDEAIAMFRQAIKLKPALAQAHFHLGAALADQGKLDEAIDACRQAIALKADLPRAHEALGYVLNKQGKLDEAIAAFRQAIKLKPDYAQAHSNLGAAIALQGKLEDKLDEVIYHCRQAIELDRDSATTRWVLANALFKQGKLDEAIAQYRKAIELKPDWADTHSNLGVALLQHRKLEEALAAFRKAIKLKPDYALNHYNLGNALYKQGKLDEAITAYRKAIELKPDWPAAHFNLGNALYDQGKLDEAITAFRKAIELKPPYAIAHLNLGVALRDNGEFAEALIALKRGHELGSRDPQWRQSSARLVRECEKRVELDARLSRVLTGKETVGDARERIAFAELCYRKRQFEHAASFYEAALSQEPGLGGDPKDWHRYNAAGMASLASIGDGKDASALGDEQRGRRRRQALDWLRADLRQHALVLDKAAQASRATITKTLQHWLQDPHLRGLRDDDYLTKLPREDRHACAILWSDVRELLARAQSK